MAVYWWRVEDSRTTAGAVVSLRSLPVIDFTLKGVWLDDFGRKRFVLRGARKRYACPTREEALESFRARKNRQLKILQAHVRHVEQALERAEENLHGSRA